MTLKKFLETTGVNPTDFSKSTGININTLYTYLSGKSEPGAKNALLIIRATHGAVKLEDLALK